MAESWYKVDNVAKVFLASNSRRDPRVFRVSCSLNENEPIDPDLLNKALAATAHAVPQFQVTLHRGLFWHYFESTNKLPVAVPETLSPCAPIYGPELHNELLYRVSYFGSRINVEMFHALTDGNGGLMFLKILVHNYLKLVHPAEMDGVPQEKGASEEDMRQDSYQKFYNGSRDGIPALPTKAKRKAKPYRLHKLHLPYDQHQYFEGHLPVKQMLAKAHEVGVSLTSYLAAAMIMAVYQEMPALERHREIAVSIPVNLRNYYPSATARNFFNSIRVGYAFQTGEETFEQVAQAFDTEMKNALSPEQVKARMDNYEKIEMLPFIKPVPLIIKNAIVSMFSQVESGNVTFTLSNMGAVPVPQGEQPFVEGFSSYCSTSTLFTVVVSYGGDLVLGTTSGYRSTNVLKNFYRGLSAAGVDVTVYATEVYDQ